MATDQIIRPNGIDTDNANWTASAGAKADCISDQSDATYITSAAPLEAILFTYSDLIVAGNTAVDRIVLWSRISGDNTSEFGAEFKHGGTTVTQTRDNFTADTSRATVEVNWDLTFLRPGGGQWIVDDVNNIAAGIFQTNWSGAGQVDVLEQWLVVTYAETPTQLPAPREVASRILRQRRTMRKVFSGQTPPEILDLELLTDLGIIHRDAPTSDGQGYGPSKSTRGLARLESIEVDMNADPGDGFRVAVSACGLRHYAVNLWDLGKALSAGPLQDGCPILDGGQARTYSRASICYVNDPSDSRVVAVQYDLEPIAANGTYVGRLLEGSAKNYIPHSSFAAGAAPFTDTGTGYNGSSIDTIEYDNWSPIHLFDPKVSRFFTRFMGWTASSPAPAPMRREWPASDSVSANTNLFLSLDRRHEGGISGGAELTVWLRRNHDSLWYQWDGTWGLEATGGFTVAPSPAAAPNRYAAFGNIPSGANASTFSLFVGIAAALANGKTSYVYHAQLEAGSWASSRFVTGPAGATRAASLLSYANPEANRIWSAQRGAVVCKLLPDWSSGVIAAASFKTIAYCYHNANNYAWLYWDKDNARWVFEVGVGGTVKRAIKSASVSSTVPVAIAARWTSNESELGLTPYTISIFVDGVKGTDDVAAGAMVELDASDGGGAGLHIGTKNSLYPLDGALSEIELLPYVPDDTEIARLAL